MDNQQPPSGFSPHVLNQINQINQAFQQVPQSQRGQGRGRGRGRGRGGDQSRQYHHPSDTTDAYSRPPPSMDSYPPLGSHLSQVRASAPGPTPWIQPSQHMVQPSQPSNQPRDFSDRVRGAYRGHQSRSYQYPTGNHPHQPQSNNDYRRPPTQHRTLYQQNPGPSANSWQASSAQQRQLRQQTMAQADHLNQVQQECRNRYQLKQEEQVTKEDFRKRLENFFQDVLSKQHPDIDPRSVRLKCYGSLNNGFGLAGCDMDLLLALPENLTRNILTKLPDTTPSSGLVTYARKPADQSDDATTEGISNESEQDGFQVGWLLEGALLDAGIGARLLTKTRVPILKVCQSPSKELLQTLRQYRIEQIQVKTPEPSHSVCESTLPPSLDMKALDVALSNLDDQDDAAKVSLPESPTQRPGASLEFDGDFGIKCDVNFGNSLAVHNTRLLREYCMFDPRVAQVGVFVKTWAKIRDINTPYYGTLSSYGYVLMVLHFLMNVVKPPVIPNLQYLAHNEDAWSGKPSVDLFEGKYDIRFLADKRKIEDYRQTMTINRDSTGNLIRGFFWYYTARDGFNWKNDVISLRTQGGILKKFAKGWTEAKWSEQASKKNVRLRFLMAIEDPFEIEHNVARVVGHNGIVAIRDEFRRCWDIISRIGTEDPLTEGLMEPMEGRGDTLRKDQDHHREKMKMMKESYEAKERKLRQIAASENGISQENGTSSDSEFPSFPLRSVSGSRRSSSPRLTSRVGASQNKPRQSSRRVRKVKDESDGEDGDEVETAPTHIESKTVEEVDEDTEPFCRAEDIHLAHGFDVWGNPVGWDVSTQDGRWLQWRDNKIREGTWKGAKRPDLVALDTTYLYDDRRPHSESLPIDLHPPFPLNKYEHEGKTSDVVAQHHKPNRRRKLVSSKAPEVASIGTENSTTVTVSAPTGSTTIGPPAIDAIADDTATTSSTMAISSITSPTTAVPATTAPTAPLLNKNEQAMLPLRWSTRTAGGYFLRRRDLLIRSGEFKVTDLDEWEQEVHSNFPYDPEMLRSTLGKYNHELAKIWVTRPPRKDSQRPEKQSVTLESRPADVHDNITTAITGLKDLPSKLEQVSPSLSGNLTFTNTQTPIPYPLRTESVVSELTVTTNETEEDMANSAFIRSRRLAYFAQALEAGSSQTVDRLDKDEQTVKTLMREAGIDIHRPQLTKKDSAIGIWASSESETQSETEFQPKEQLSQQVEAVNSDTAEHEFENTSEEQIEANQKVPSSLYRNLPNDRRPRDENHEIMPIPRKQGFRFDVRQLRDLAVIKEGGNGCARAGEEFNIEEDYELGGGGEMGYKSSSDVRLSSASDREVYEYGKGDEGGLLNELPRIEE